MMARPRRSRRPWGRLQRLKNGAIYNLAVAARWLLGRLPLALTLAFGRGVGLLAWALAAAERRKAEAHLEIAYPELAPRSRAGLARQCFVSLGQRAAEVCWLDRLDLERYVEIPAEDRRVIEGALERGQGVLWVTAHLGNWELLAAGLAARSWGVWTVATESYDPRFTALIDRWRLSRGVKTLWRGRDGLSEGIAEALAEGQILGLLIDQDTRTRGHFVPFFGRPAWTPSGAAVLARESGAPVVAGFISQRSEGGHVIRAQELEVQRGGEPDEDDLENTARFTAAIEASIRRRPEEWVWMHERWRRQPGDQGAR